MGNNNWIQQAIVRKGAMNQNIPSAKLRSAAGKNGRTGKEVLRSFHNK